MGWIRTHWKGLVTVALAVAGGVWAYTSSGPDLAREYRIGYNHNPPYQLHREGQPPAGLAVDVANEAAARMGIRLRWVYLSENPDKAIGDGRADLWPIAIVTKARHKKFALSAPWLKSTLWLTTRADREQRPGLAGQRLAVVDTTFPLPVVQEQFPKALITKSVDRPRLFAGVCDGSWDGAVLDIRAVAALLLRRPPSCDGLELKTTPVGGSELEMAVMGAREQSAIVERLREGITQLAQERRIQPIFGRWRMGFTGEGEVVESLLAAERSNRIMMWSIGAMAALLAGLLWAARNLRLSREAAERANRAKGEFLANMSHEIRTPMNGVLGLTELLLASPLAKPDRELAQAIHNSGKSLQVILNDILDLSKMDAGKLELESVSFSIEDILRSSVNTIRPAASAKGTVMEYKIQPDVPPWLIGDPTRLSQVILNLLSNAAKFTTDGSVHIVARVEGKSLRVDVVDTGVGFGPDVAERLFQPFSQGDSSTTRKHGGTGLGLAISRRLIEMMKGSIACRSTPRKGSHFWFSIPLAVGSPPPEAAMAGGSETAVDAGRRLRILIAEDNVVNQRVTRAFVEALGHSCDIAVNGEQVCEMFEKGDYDIVLMDCQMPLVDGWEATRRIRLTERGSTVPIVALTANAMSGDREGCLAAGMSGYLAKPFSKRALEETLAAQVPA